MEAKAILSLILPLLFGVIGSYLTYFLTSKSKRDEIAFKFKEERYINLLLALQGFFKLTASADLKRKFLEEQYKSWLYCSDDVIEAVNEFVDYFKTSYGTAPDSKKANEAIGKIVLAMRRDLIKSTRLRSSAFSYTEVVK